MRWDQGRMLRPAKQGGGHDQVDLVSILGTFALINNGSSHRSQMEAYKVEYSIPSLLTYVGLRRAAGMSGKSPEAAEIGLKNSLFAVQVTFDDETIGMGRVIGDGGCFFQVVDIAVTPTHQGKGIGKRIMGEIKHWLDENVPKTGYVSLGADGQAYKLYERFGFELTAPATLGMAITY